MYKIEYDSNLNRLNITLEGFIKLEEAIAFRKESEAAHGLMKPGGSFLMDGSKLTTLPQDTLDEIQKTRKHAVAAGLGSGAVVLPTVTLKMQQQRTASQVDGFKEVYFKSVSEARNYLDGLEK